MDTLLRRWMTWVLAVGLVLGLAGAIAPQSAAALDYPPPLSFSNAELMGQDFSGENLRGAELSNANLVQAKFEGSDLRGAVFSASVMNGANLHGANAAYSMMDQVNFTGADLTDVIFAEAILLRSIFDGADITGADFSDAILDGDQVRILCAIAAGVNPETGMETRDSLACR